MIWGLIGLLRLIKNEIPALINFTKTEWKAHLDRKAQVELDKLEHEQNIEDKLLTHETMERLIDRGSRTFLEEQVTQITADILSESSTDHDFIRSDVSRDIRTIISQVDTLARKVDDLPDQILARLREDIRAELREIADNWRTTLKKLNAIQKKLGGTREDEE